MKSRPPRAWRAPSRQRTAFALSLSSAVAAAGMACGMDELDQSYSENEVTEIGYVNDLAVGTFTNLRLVKQQPSPDGHQDVLTKDMDLTFLDKAATYAQSSAPDYIEQRLAQGEPSFWRLPGKAPYDQIEHVVFGSDGWAEAVVATLEDEYRASSAREMYGLNSGRNYIHVHGPEGKTELSPDFAAPMEIPVGGAVCNEPHQCEMSAKFDDAFQVLPCAPANWVSSGSEGSDVYDHPRFPYLCRSPQEPQVDGNPMAELDDVIEDRMAELRAYTESIKNQMKVWYEGQLVMNECWDDPSVDYWDGYHYCMNWYADLEQHLRLAAIYLNHGVVRLSSHNQESMFTLAYGARDISGKKAVIFYASDHNSGPGFSWAEVNVSGVPRVWDLVWGDSGLLRFLRWSPDFGGGEPSIPMWNENGFRTMIADLQSKVFGMKLADLAVTTEPVDGQRDVHDINQLLEGGDLGKPTLDVHMAVIDIPQSEDEINNLHILLGSTHEHRMQNIYILQMILYL